MSFSMKFLVLGFVAFFCATTPSMAGSLFKERFLLPFEFDKTRGSYNINKHTKKTLDLLQAEIFTELKRQDDSSFRDLVQIFIDQSQYKDHRIAYYASMILLDVALSDKVRRAPAPSTYELLAKARDPEFDFQPQNRDMYIMVTMELLNRTSSTAFASFPVGAWLEKILFENLDNFDFPYDVIKALVEGKFLAAKKFGGMGYFLSDDKVATLIDKAMEGYSNSDSNIDASSIGKLLGSINPLPQTAVNRIEAYVLGPNSPVVAGKPGTAGMLASFQEAGVFKLLNEIKLSSLSTELKEALISKVLDFSYDDNHKSDFIDKMGAVRKQKINDPSLIQKMIKILVNPKLNDDRIYSYEALDALVDFQDASPETMVALARALMNGRITLTYAYQALQKLQISSKLVRVRFTEALSNEMQAYFNSPARADNRNRSFIESNLAELLRKLYSDGWDVNDLWKQYALSQDSYSDLEIKLISDHSGKGWHQLDSDTRERIETYHRKNDEAKNTTKRAQDLTADCALILKALKTTK